MWWGGGKDSGESEGDPSSSRPPSNSSDEVMEILSEEDVRPEAAEAVEDAAEDEEDAEDAEALARLKESFKQQEDILGQLKGALTRNEDKLMKKETEVQVCSFFSLPFCERLSSY